MDVIIHVDIETLGRVGGLNPMIAIGAAAYQGDVEISHFNESITWEEGELGLKVDSETLKWWEQFPEQLESILKSGRPANTVVSEFVDWCIKLPGERKVFAAWPSVFDIGFLRWYVNTFRPDVLHMDLFNYFHTMDIRSYMAVYFGVPYSEASRKLVPESWVKNMRISHDPLDDARWQAAVLNRILGDVGEILGEKYAFE